MIVWDVEHAAAGETLAGHAGQITGLAISRDGQTLYSAALDGKVLIWDLAGTRRLGRPFDLGPGNPAAVAPLRAEPRRPRPRGRTRRRHRQPDRRPDAAPLSTASACSATGRSAAWGSCPHSRLLVVGGDDGLPRPGRPDRAARSIRRLHGAGRATAVACHARLQRRRTPHGHAASAATTASCACGRCPRADRSAGRCATVRRPRRRRRVAQPRRAHAGRHRGTDRRPTRGVEIVDVATLRRRASLPGTETVTDLARFTPDGRFVVAGSWKGWARLWSTKTWKPATPRVRRARRTRGVGVHQPGRPHARHRRPGRRHPALGPAHPTAARRPAARRCPTTTPSRSSRPTAPTCSPSPTPGAPTAGTCARPRGRATPATSPAARSRRAEWQDALPGRDYAPAC